MQVLEPANRCSVKGCGAILYTEPLSCEARQRRISRHYQEKHPKLWLKYQVQNGKKIIDVRYIKAKDDVALWGLLSSVPLAADVMLLLPKLLK